MIRSIAHARRAVGPAIRALRASPLLAGDALREIWHERAGGHPVDRDDLPHLMEAVDWLVRGQDATPGDGISRGYSLIWHPHFTARGWQPSYPETTGYIIPTLYQAARILQRPDLARRAERAARWEIEIQLPGGAVRGGVIGQKVSPAVFNTGQVLLGWLSAYRETGEETFREAAFRAGRFLCSVLEEDGHWRRGNSSFARKNSTLYNARTAWALTEAGLRLEDNVFLDSGARALRAIWNAQNPNGWVPDCCLSDPERPLLHTLAYAIRGLLEGGRALEDDRLIQSAAVAAEQIAGAVRDDGSIPGRFTSDWSPVVTWSCLTGNAQMANIWIRLHEITGERQWLEPIPPVMTFLKSTQNRTSRNLGLRGGIKGSAPLQGPYGRYQILSWAAKFFIDALMRHRKIRPGQGADHGSEEFVMG